ncbi:hypothetical protein [Sphingomonas sp. 28-62-11]|uniref:hypothetical protein n=1 Tax=Sphingomonas sp. 28-62-11 TaxID=1970432 RepID=UPI0035A94F25
MAIIRVVFVVRAVTVMAAVAKDEETGARAPSVRQTRARATMPFLFGVFQKIVVKR